MATSTPSGAILVIGASLEAERIVHLVRQLPDPPTILGLLTVDPMTEQVGVPVCGLPVLDTIENLANYADQVVGAVPAAEDPENQETVIAAMALAGIHPLPVVHPKACLGHGVNVAPGAAIHANATIDVGVRIGRGAVIGVGAVVGARTRVGDYARVSLGCVVGNEVRLGERVQLALGSRVIDGLLIGPGAAVGPGSLVVNDVAGETAVIGNPAQPVVRNRHPEVDNA